MENPRYLAPAHAPGVTVPQPLEMLPVKGPSQEDWNRHQSLIKHLYADEDMKLKDVMDIMLKHGHKASLRTYKNWIKKWGLEKNNKERDMVAIVRKKTQRDSIGKQSSFRVRGQTVTMENITRYFKRKTGASMIETLDISTPSDISCRTPSPPSTPRDFGDSTRPYLAEDGLGTAQLSHRSHLASNINKETLGVTNGELTSVSRSEINEDAFQENIKIFFALHSNNHRVSHSPSPPQIFAMPERLFFSITKLIEGSFENGTWVVGEHGLSESTKAVASSGSIPYESFIRYCYIAIEFLDNGYFVESRRALSKMFNLICGLLQDGGPRILDTFFQVFCSLQKEYHNIWLLLRHFIHEMAQNTSLKDCPLAQILRILCALDDDSLEQTIFQCWRCVIDGFTKSLGLFNHNTLIIQIYFIRSIYGVQELMEEERCYQSLLTQSKVNSNATVPAVLNIMFNLIENLIVQERYDEAEALALDMLSSAQKANLLAWESDAKYLVARGQYYQHKGHLAEENLRDVIKIWGEADISIIERMLELEQWLREWGREKEADDLKAEIDELIGPDEIDLEMAQIAQ